VCRPGFFKASPHSQSCSKCPPHSYTHEEASTSCVCEKDYFRRESDPPTMACTSKENPWIFGDANLHQFEEIA